MSQTYTIIAIVGFSLAAVLAAIAVIMFFTLHIKAVRDDLTGKTAARSIAEIRSRAKTRKRTGSQVAKRYGWEKEELSTDALKEAVAASRGDSTKRAAKATGPFGRSEAVVDEDEVATTMLDEAGVFEDDEAATTFCGPEPTDEEDEAATTIFASESDEEDEAATTIFTSESGEEDEAATTMFAPAEDGPEEASTTLLTEEAGSSAKKPQAGKAAGVFALLIALAGAAGVVGMPTGSASAADTLFHFPQGDDPIEIVVPYGVNIEEWLNKQDIYQEDLAEVKALFVDGTPLVVVFSGGEYPAEDAPVDVEWGELTEEATEKLGEDELPSVEQLAIKAGKIETCLTSQIEFSKSTAVIYSGDQPRIWLSSISPAPSIARVDPACTMIEKPEPLSLSDVGTIAGGAASLPLPAAAENYPQFVYVQLGSDETISEAMLKTIDPNAQGTLRLCAGQIIALPKICYDEKDPAFGENPVWIPEASPAPLPEVGTWYTLQATLRVSAEDLIDDPPDPEEMASIPFDDRASGIAEVKLLYRNSNGLLGDMGERTAYGSASGETTFDIALEGDGVFELSAMTVVVTDKAGRSVSRPLGDLYPDPESMPAFSRICISSRTPVIALECDPASGGVYRSDVSVTASITEYTFAASAQNAGGENVLGIMLDGNPVVDENFELGNFAAVSPDPENITHQASSVFSDEGFYRLSLAYANINGKAPAPVEASFLIDKTEPHINGMRWGYDPEAEAVSSYIYFTQRTTLAIDVSDLKVIEGAESGAVSVSGIKEMTLRGRSATGVSGKVYEFEGVRTGAEGSKTDTFTFSFEEEGEFAFADLAVSITDMAGNTYEKSLLDFFGEDPDAALAAARSAFGFSTVVVNRTPARIGLYYATSDVSNDCYYRSDRILTVVIEDPYFAAAAEHHRREAGEAIEYDAILDILVESPAGTQRASLTYGDFRESKYSPGTWIASKDTAHIAEGWYTLSLGYANLSNVPSAEAEDSVTKINPNADRFCLDKTDPTLGAATVSPAAVRFWDWLFSPGEATIEVQLDDELSGIDVAATSFAVNDAAYPSVYNPEKKTLSCTFPADDRRVAFSRVKVHIHDMAGNANAIMNFQEYEDKNVDAKTKGVVCDGAAPAIEVTYDNYDVRNGLYYNAPRTATVTLTEASFDMVKANDEYRAIATQTIGGSNLPVTAKDFENPSGDGVTWVAAIPCERDGVYAVDASFTDPSGKPAHTYHEDFVVDLTAPMIMIAFDNNEAESGMYFKAPRTATVAIRETNFSADMASVSTTAADAAGAAVAAPGASGFSAAGENVHTATVHFGSELHYTMQAGCTDLAGNPAEVVEVPEFVIDMTAPVVHIDRVEDHAAYANEVAPLISFSDTNFMPYYCEIDIVGAAQGEEVYLKNSDAATDTTRTVDYADFEYRVQSDDIYTFTAKIKDKAGNTAEETVTFSVNRFGSNYTFSAATKPLIGGYLQKPQDIVITETNVSGIDSSLVRMARNSSIGTLAPGDDYEVRTQGDQTSWSSYTYTFPAALFEDDGYYRLMLSSHDIAGNLSENLMAGKNEDRTGAFEVAFAIDGTAPEASLANVEPSTAYFGPSQRIDVFAVDNMEAEGAVLYANGEAVREWDGEGLAAERMFSVDLPASDQPYALKLEVTDRAGNTYATETRGVTVTSDWLRYIMETPAILYPLIAGVIVLMGLGGIIAGRVSASRAAARKRQEARQQHFAS